MIWRTEKMWTGGRWMDGQKSSVRPGGCNGSSCDRVPGESFQQKGGSESKIDA
jgi:hypothetical protein